MRLHILNRFKYDLLTHNACHRLYRSENGRFVISVFAIHLVLYYNIIVI